MSRDCPEGNYHTIKAGETLFQIARAFNVSLADLIEANPGIDPDRLTIGQVICIPLAAPPVPCYSGCIPAPRKIYSSPAYKVVFLYPPSWIGITGQRYEGPEGFFQVAATGGGSLDEVCKNEAFHLLRPYGTEPNIQKITIHEQEACLILPSTNQPPEMKNQAALIVKYPKPVQIAGQPYNYFVLWATDRQIEDLAATLEFLI